MKGDNKYQAWYLRQVLRIDKEPVFIQIRPMTGFFRSLNHLSAIPVFLVVVRTAHIGDALYGKACFAKLLTNGDGLRFQICSGGVPQGSSDIIDRAQLN